MAEAAESLVKTLFTSWLTTCKAREVFERQVVESFFNYRLRKLPPQYNAFEVKENLARMGALLPMNIFLRLHLELKFYFLMNDFFFLKFHRQEVDRMQKVIKTVYTNLCDLKLAIDGTIVMSQYLRDSLDAMYDARIPERWQKVKS